MSTLDDSDQSRQVRLVSAPASRAVRRAVVELVLDVELVLLVELLEDEDEVSPLLPEVVSPERPRSRKVTSPGSGALHESVRANEPDPSRATARRTAR